MFKIGEFARLGSVSIRSLRHYHELGLLVPAEVDRATGYRRYSARQLHDLNRVVALKELGFSLAQISVLLTTVTVDELRGMFTLRRAQLESEAHDLQLQLREIEARVRIIEKEGQMPEHEIVLKVLPAQRVATIGHHAKGFGGANLGPILGPGVVELYEILSANDVAVVGQPFAFYEGEPGEPTFTAYVAFPVDQAVAGLPDPVVVRDLPRVQEAATVVLLGPDDTTHAAAYGELARWIEASGYEITGHGRDVFLNTTPPESDDDLLMEAQLPLRRATS